MNTDLAPHCLTGQYVGWQGLKQGKQLYSQKPADQEDGGLVYLKKQKQKNNLTYRLRQRTFKGEGRTEKQKGGKEC